MIAAILAVLKAGRIYVPFDPAILRLGSPTCSRTLRPQLLVTDHRNLPLARELAGDSTLPVLDLDETVPTLKADQSVSEVPPDATCLYSLHFRLDRASKGDCPQSSKHHTQYCMLHQCLPHWVDDRLTMFHSSSFSSALVDIFCALFNGGVVHPLGRQAIRSWQSGPIS